MAFQLHKRLGAKIPDSGGSLQDAEVRRLPVLSQLLERSVSSNFSQIFPFLMKFLLCAQRKIEFFELENCPLCVFLLGISYSEQPRVVLELPKAESVVVLKGRQQFSIHLQF